MWDFELEIFESLLDELLETGVAFVERPPENLGIFLYINIMG